MDSTLTAAQPTSGSAGLSRAQRDRVFFSTMAVLAALTVLVGFSRTYFLRGYFGSPAVSPLLHVHGLLFTAWVGLFVVQTLLVAARRVSLHRRLGVAGAMVAALMLPLGLIAARDAVHRGSAPLGIPPLAFSIIPFGDVIVFASLVAAALWFRRRPGTHKRLMLLATVALLAAPIARIPAIQAAGPLAFFGLADLFIVACAIYDWRTLGRIQPATLWGGLTIILSQPLRLALASTPLWLTVAAALFG